ncbi:nuclear transport factor 2 family protein [Candidatus Woesearchaeota archaeon]|nr:nuclear transport factor 2 family protein [Candidatus Woesearchaeota archaeon]
MNKKHLIESYFKARATSDLQALQTIFTDDIAIYNVHFPVFQGREGVKSYCTDFQQRISSCTFDILEILEKEAVAMVEWTAKLTYRTGAIVAGLAVARPFTLELRGINRFDFTNDKISCLRVYHETSSVLNLVKEHAK